MEADQAGINTVAPQSLLRASVSPELQGKKGWNETSYKVWGRLMRLLLRATTIFHF